MSREHVLKCEKPIFEDVEAGRKPFELRYNDRGYQLGDTLLLRETDGAFYSGKEIRRVITYVLNGWGLKEGFVALGLGIPAPPRNDDVPEITKEILLGGDGVWRIGGKIVSAEEGRAAMRAALSESE